MEQIQKIIGASIEIKQSMSEQSNIIAPIADVVDEITATFENDGKVLFCGNGGSAADAQHIAAEFSGRFYRDRAPLFSEALHVNTSYLTAVSNDFGYEEAYARLVRAMGRVGDVLVCLSTSGDSPNIVAAARIASEIGMSTVALTGREGGELAPLCTHAIRVPSTDTPRIQEAHIMIGHIICELVEARLFPDS
jgi:D-sedoheptulose 7-phosphate isomerase